MYNRIFRSLFYGSMKGQGDLQLVWTFMIAHADLKGHVVNSPPDLIALVTGKPLAVVDKALEILQAPDPKSRTPEHEGRRIEGDGLGDWIILNFAKFKEMKDLEAQREQTSIRVARHRNKKKAARPVTVGNTRKRRATTPDVRPDSEAEGEEACAALQRADALAGKLGRTALLDAHGVEPDSDEARELDLYLGLTAANDEPYANAGRATLLRTPDWRDTVGAIRVPKEIRDQAEGNRQRVLTLLEAAGRDKELDAQIPKPVVYGAAKGKDGPPRLHVGAVYELAKKAGLDNAGQRTCLQICQRLFNAGIRHPAVLTAVAKHYGDHQAGIRNPWAYYSPGGSGFDFIRSRVGAERAIAEAAVLERATKDWLAGAVEHGEKERAS